MDKLLDFEIPYYLDCLLPTKPINIVYSDNGGKPFLEYCLVLKPINNNVNNNSVFLTKNTLKINKFITSIDNNNFTKSRLRNSNFSIKFVNNTSFLRDIFYYDYNTKSVVEITHPDLDPNLAKYYLILDNTELISLLGSNYTTNINGVFSNTFCFGYSLVYKELKMIPCSEMSNTTNYFKEIGRVIMNCKLTTDWIPGHIYYIPKIKRPILYLGIISEYVGNSYCPYSMDGSMFINMLSDTSIILRGTNYLAIDCFYTDKFGPIESEDEINYINKDKIITNSSYKGSFIDFFLYKKFYNYLKSNENYSDFIMFRNKNFNAIDLGEFLSFGPHKSQQTNLDPIDSIISNSICSIVDQLTEQEKQKYNNQIVKLCSINHYGNNTININKDPIKNGIITKLKSRASYLVNAYSKELKTDSIISILKTSGDYLILRYTDKLIFLEPDLTLDDIYTNIAKELVESHK